MKECCKNCIHSRLRPSQGGCRKYSCFIEEQNVEANYHCKNYTSRVKDTKLDF